MTTVWLLCGCWAFLVYSVWSASDNESYSQHARCVYTVLGAARVLNGLAVDQNDRNKNRERCPARAGEQANP